MTTAVTYALIDKFGRKGQISKIVFVVYRDVCNARGARECCVLVCRLRVPSLPVVAVCHWGTKAPGSTLPWGEGCVPLRFRGEAGLTGFRHSEELYVYTYIYIYTWICIDVYVHLSVHTCIHSYYTYQFAYAFSVCNMPIRFH